MEKMPRITMSAARVNAGLTQGQLAEEMGVSRTTVVSWEKGRTAPDITQAKRLAEVVGLDLDFIFFEKNVYKK